VPQTVTESMKRVDDFIMFEEAYKSTELPKGEHPDKGQGTSYRGSRPPHPGHGGGHQRTDNYNTYIRRDHYQPYVPTRVHNPRYDNRQQEVNRISLDSLIKRPKKILATELQLHLPPCPPMVGTPKKENLDKYCDYHVEKWHYTNDCYQLRRQLEAALESRKLSHLVKDVRQRGNNRGIQEGNNSIKGKIINMVWLEEKQVVPERGLDEEILKDKKEPTEEEVFVNPAFPKQKDTIGTQFLPACRLQLMNLLKENKEVFAWQPSDMIGVPRRIIQHSLNVNLSITPVAQKRRVLGPEKSKAVTKEVEEWVKAGIVRPVWYPTWISNPVLVKKVDSSCRMCIDFKNVDSACPKDYYLLPEIDLKIEATGQEMIADIADTFDSLRRVNMKLNPKKCSFRVKEGKFLGYMVTSEGIKANPKKTKTMADVQSPKTLKEMQSLSEKLIALNRFLSRSAERALPFFETLKNVTNENKDDYRWMKDAERAFQEMKKLVLELPTLTTPDLKETLYVYLVASKEAVSGVLVADRKGK
ncbi:hypothetical protein Tco_1170770, partial [Tanacetum coccineum]